ncbi:MAG: DUF4389 domain-containing protein [bacterium]|nr:DUF4389 domain-containing protein [bacterium]
MNQKENKQSKNDKKESIERKEAIMRILVAIVSGIIIELWGIVVQFMGLINWLNALINGKRSKVMANFCEMWNTQRYDYVRYITGHTNKRPFPFKDTSKSMSEFDA